VIGAVTHEPRFQPAQVLWFVLGDSLLAIGAAFTMESFFLYTISAGGFRQADNAGYLGLILMLVGGAVAIGSVFARPADDASAVSSEARIH
jgi:hypothetical protein